MVNGKSKTDESYSSLLLLEEIVKDEGASQRVLSKRLGIAVGLVNSYMKNMIAKGYVRVKAFPRNRYTYLVTPKGLAEKSRLTYQHLNYFTNLYTNVRRDYVELFRRLEAEGIKNVVFCGVDEVAEIAYLSLQETDIVLAGVFDDEGQGREFFRHSVLPFGDIVDATWDRIIVTSLKKCPEVMERLALLDVDYSLLCGVEREMFRSC